MIYYDPLFWVLISFLLLILIGFGPIKTRVITYLDTRTAEIRSTLEKAQNLREEAQLVVAEQQVQQQKSQKEAQTIIEQAKEQARLFEQQAYRDLEFLITQRQAQLQARITQMEVKALESIRDKILKTAVAASRHLLQQRLASLGRDPSVDQTLTDLPTYLVLIKGKE